MSPTGRGNTSHMVFKVSHTGPSATAANAGRDSAPSVTCWTGCVASNSGHSGLQSRCCPQNMALSPQTELVIGRVSRSPSGRFWVDAALGPLPAPALMKLAGPARKGAVAAAWLSHRACRCQQQRTGWRGDGGQGHTQGSGRCFLLSSRKLSKCRGHEAPRGRE